MALTIKWLQADPLLGSRELVMRLVAHAPGRDSDRQMRPSQRRLRIHRLGRIEAEMSGRE